MRDEVARENFLEKVGLYVALKMGGILKSKS